MGRLQHRAPSRGARCVGVKCGGGWVCPEFLKILWVLDGEVASEEEAVDSCWRQEGLGLVLLLRVEYLAEVKARQRNIRQTRNVGTREATLKVGVDQAPILD